MNQEKIGKFIAKLRKEHQMTQEDLAEKLYVDRATISKWETGKYVVNPDMLLKLSKLFEVSINEILVGERSNEDNQDKINNVSLEILNDTSRKTKIIKRLISFSIISIILLLMLFLLYYFLVTYNSIRVYIIAGENDNFYVKDSLIVVSREQVYIDLASIKSKNKKDIELIRLYYVDNGKQKNLVTVDDSAVLFINVFSPDELFSYSEVDLVKNNLFLEISYEKDKKEIVKLKTAKCFSNTRFFGNYMITNLFKKSNNNTDNDYNYGVIVPQFIKNNFKYDSDQNQYYLETRDDGIKYHHSYIVDAELYILEEFNREYVDHFEYEIDDSFVIYSKITENKMDNNFTYDLKNKTCFYGECDLDKVNYFLDKYLNKIIFEDNN